VQHTGNLDATLRNEPWKADNKMQSFLIAWTIVELGVEALAMMTLKLGIIWHHVGHFEVDTERATLKWNHT